MVPGTEIVEGDAPIATEPSEEATVGTTDEEEITPNDILAQKQPQDDTAPGAAETRKAENTPPESKGTRIATVHPEPEEVKVASVQSDVEGLKQENERLRKLNEELLAKVRAISELLGSALALGKSNEANVRLDVNLTMGPAISV